MNQTKMLNTLIRSLPKRVGATTLLLAWWTAGALSPARAAAPPAPNPPPALLNDVSFRNEVHHAIDRGLAALEKDRKSVV